MKVRRAVFCAMLAAWGVATSGIAAEGPGVPNQSYTPEEVFTVLSTIDSQIGAPRAHGNVSMHRGYLAIIYSRDGGRGDGGFSFYDISNPRAPRLVFAKDDAETEDIREAHGYGFSNRYPGHLVALQATRGIQIWDWTQVTHPVRLAYLRLPGITASDYSTGAWWVFWQAPYIYVGGSANGIYIVDATDPRAPVLVDRGAGRPNPIPIGETGGFRVGPVFAIGNVLVASCMNGGGYATFDIGDPKNPVLLQAQVVGMPFLYSCLVNGNRILGVDLYSEIHVHDISDPSQFAFVNHGPIYGRGGYLTFQDGFAHVGASNRYSKVDLRDDAQFVYAGTATSGIPDGDEDFATVLGNLVVISDDHGNGSVIVPHQAEPDTRGPAVNMVVPRDGALYQATTSRVGLTFTDLVDLRTVDESTFIVRPRGGSPLPGNYSTQTGIVNFSPSAPLQPNIVYEVIVPAGGIRDLAGNATETEFRSVFSTGSTLNPISCRVRARAPAEIGTAAGFRVFATGGSAPLTYSWDFGDGSPVTGPSSDPTAIHFYSSAGRFTVRAGVTDGTIRKTCAVIQIVHRPLTPLPPSTSNSIVFDRERNRAWTVNSDNDSVAAIDALGLVRLFEAPVGRNPRTLAQAPDGRIWVVNQDDATISVLGADQGALLGTIRLPTASRPYGIAFRPDGAAAYVTLEATGRLIELNPGTGAVVGEVSVGPRPRGIAITGDSRRILVTRFVSPEDRGEVVAVGASSLVVVGTIALAKDAGPDAENTGRGVPNYLSSIAISPDGRRAWVPSKKDNVDRGRSRDGLPLTFESTVRTIVSQIDLETGAEDLPARIDLNDRCLAAAVAFSRLGDLAFVANLGSNTVDVFDATSRELITSLEDVGLGPEGLAFGASQSELLVQSALSRTISVYDVRDLVTARGSNAIPRAVIPTVSQERLDAQVLRGKQIFYNANDPRMSRDGYLTCATCHLDGGDDGRTWDFTDRGEGLRNSISLFGRRGVGEGRLHWTGNFDEVQDFETDVRRAFRGEGFLSDRLYARGTRSRPLGDPKAGLSSDLDALAAYVESLGAIHRSPYRRPDRSLTPNALAGRVIFTRLRCLSCHGGPDFTDSGSGVSHDVGTIRPSSGERLGQPLLGLDTPTLRGIWETAPYLHDGSAPTLLDVLTTANPLGKHGATAELSAAELQQLVSYLLQIDDVEPGAIDADSDVVVTAPADRDVFAEGDAISIVAQIAAGADAAQGVEFFADGVLLAADDMSPFRFDWLTAAAGEHTITARTRLESGAQTTADPVTVTVLSDRCRRGNVNGATGPIVDVLFVNGSTGEGIERRVVVRPDERLTVFMQSPPSVIGRRAGYALFCWVGAPTPFTETRLPGALGWTCLPTPPSGGSPTFIANNLRHGRQLGVENWPQAPTSPAPTVVLDVPGGLRRPITLFLQGLIHDTASPDGQVAVTNGVLLVSE